MIPGIEEILEGYKAGLYDMGQCLLWISEHFQGKERLEFAAVHIAAHLTVPMQSGPQYSPQHIAEVAVARANALCQALDDCCVNRR